MLLSLTHQQFSYQMEACIPFAGLVNVIGECLTTLFL